MNKIWIGIGVVGALLVGAFFGGLVFPPQSADSQEADPTQTAQTAIGVTPSSTPTPEAETQEEETEETQTLTQEEAEETETTEECFSYEIPDDAEAWSSGSLWLVAPAGMEVSGSGERWFQEGDEWDYSHTVSYTITNVTSVTTSFTTTLDGCLCTCVCSSSWVSTNLQYTRFPTGTVKNEYYNDVTKSVRWCASSESDQLVAVLFEDDEGPDYGWALAFFGNGEVEFIPAADVPDELVQLIEEAEEYVLPQQ